MHYLWIAVKGEGDIQAKNKGGREKNGKKTQIQRKRGVGGGRERERKIGGGEERKEGRECKYRGAGEEKVLFDIQ